MGEQSNAERLSKLRAELKKAEQAPVVPDINRVGWTFQAYSVNTSLLRRHIETPHDDFNVAVETRAPGKNPEIYRRYYAELIRLLLNYTASASTLVDHMRIVEQKMEVANHDEHAELITRRRQVSHTGSANFIKNLRNFVLHRDLPQVAGEISFTQGNARFTFDTLLDPNSLLKWDGWSRASKQFMTQHNPISLSHTIAEYDALVRTFYDWVFKELEMVCFRNAQNIVDLRIAVDSLESQMADG